MKAAGNAFPSTIAAGNEVDLSAISSYTTDETVRDRSDILAEGKVTDMINKRTIKKTPRATLTFALACLLACGGAPAPALAEITEEAMEASEAASNSTTTTPAATTTSGEQNVTNGEQTPSVYDGQSAGDTTNVTTTSDVEGDLGTTGEAATTTTAVDEGKSASDPASDNTTTEGEMGVQAEGTSDGIVAAAAVTEELSTQEGEGAISGYWGTCAWEIDVNGVLTIRPESEEEIILPSDKINRGQLAMVLWSMAGKPAPKGMPKLFPDVTAGKYCYDAVLWASSIGVVNGYKDGRFGSEDLITREQLAAMLTNYTIKVANKVTKGSAADYAGMKDATKVSRWASRCVGWCFRNNIITATKDGLIDPQGNATCEETAKTVIKLRSML